jgi:aminopeptidase 2
VTSSHPVSVPVNNPSEINQIFDQISYKKGASLIQMMSNFLGEDVFKSGVEKYLNQNKYGNAKQVFLIH